MLHKNNIPSRISQLFACDVHRGQDFSLVRHSWLFDYSRTPLDRKGRDALLDLPRRCQLRQAVERLFAGAIVNPSEAQPALHMQLRSPDASADIQADRRRVLAQADAWHSGRSGYTDVLHIGIGGSDLGPRLVADALDAGDGAVRAHWLSTLDGRRFDRLLAGLDVQRTAVVIASKSFSTEETMTQARAVREWMGSAFHRSAWASTANVDGAVGFGVQPDQVLPFPVWTGGRYSLWSSVGVTAAAVIGVSRFTQLLKGAALADQDFLGSPDGGSLAGLIALLMHYLRRELQLPTLGMIAYEPRLALLGDYLQQLIMESLGKRVSLADEALDQPTSPLIYGGRGTDLQHSIFQALHQGTDTHPLILVGSLSDDHAHPNWQRAQLSHLLAQASAMVHGRSEGAPHRVLPGDRPVGVLLTEKLTPENLGALLASFEHAVYSLA
ncbi:MAG: hypothetical protein V2J20_00250, partial [Wenzhouxiangella sp.]|nr:hypothetical protein [Wenzhouxiangella sp.]